MVQQTAHKLLLLLFVYLVDMHENHLILSLNFVPNHTFLSYNCLCFYQLCTQSKKYQSSFNLNLKKVLTFIGFLCDLPISNRQSDCFFGTKKKTQNQNNFLSII